MATRKTVKELDSDKVDLIKMYLPQLPDYFKRTDHMYKILITGDGMDEPSGIEIIRNTESKVDQLYALGNKIATAVIGVMVTAVIGAIVLLIRLAPVLAELESIAKKMP